MLLLLGFLVPFVMALTYGAVTCRGMDTGLRKLARKLGGALIFLLPLLLLWHGTWLFVLGGADGTGIVVLFAAYWTILSALTWAPALMLGALWSQWKANRT